jgi:hypothetical protein
MQTLNVIDTAIRSGIFQTFTRLLEGSPLEARLRSQESFTLFDSVVFSALRARRVLSGSAVDRFSPMNSPRSRRRRRDALRILQIKTPLTFCSR